MILQVNFSVMLAALLLVLSSSEEVLAAPQASRRAPDGMATLPIRSLHKARSDIHPHIYLQQHINRSQKRYARMTGREPPSDLSLRSNLQKRIDGVHLGYAAGTHSHSKRYVITTKGLEKGIAEPVFIGGGDIQQQSGPLAPFKALGKLLGGSQRHGAAGGAQDTGPSAGDNSPPSIVSNSTATDPPATGNSTAATPPIVGSNSTATGNSTSSTSDGVSPIDINAAENPSVTKANGNLADNSVGLDIEANDVGYLGQVQIGTPPRNFEILMDSGSADFWVGAENCQTEGAQGQAQGQTGQGQGIQGNSARKEKRRGGGTNGNETAPAPASTGNTCGNHQFLGTQASSTFKDLNKQFQVTYGTGNVAGDIITDNVVLAGLPLNNHVFGVATQESVDFSSDQTPFDGLMGLAQSTLSEQQTPTPVESLKTGGSIDATITSFKISRLADQLNDGEVTFGGLDDTKFDKNTLVTFGNVNQQGFWEGDMVPTVNGQSVGLDKGRTAILDTGTTLIVAPPDDAAAIHQAIQGAQSDGQGGFTVPCTLNDTVSLAFSGQTFDIDPRDVAFLPVNPQDPTGDCVSGISSGQIGGATEWLVGDVFLKNAYFSINTDTNEISLAKLA